MTDQPDLDQQQSEPFNLQWTLHNCPHSESYTSLTKTSRFGWIVFFSSLVILGVIYLPLMPLAFLGLIFRDRFIYCSQCGKFLRVEPVFKIQGLPKDYRDLNG